MSSQKWRRQQRPCDRLMHDGKDTDCIVLILGSTGVGKSTFMNHIAGKTVSVVGHELISCTQDVQWHVISNPKDEGFNLDKGRRLVLVDTPGFNDTYLDDSEILRRVAIWLASSYYQGMEIAAVIQLYDISAKRLTGSTRIFMKMIEKLHGSGAINSVVIGTTKWSGKPGADESSMLRLNELEKDHWAPFLNNGARLCRVDNCRDSCMNAVNTAFVGEGNWRRADAINCVLKIQQEVVDQKKLVPRTDAGKVLIYGMKDMLKEKKKEFAEARNPELKQKIQEEIEWIQGQIGDLSPGLLQRLYWRFSTY